MMQTTLLGRQAGRAAAVGAVLLVGCTASWQPQTETTGQAQPTLMDSAAYNPYPPGILPPDLAAEIQRVRNEGKRIFNEALAEWHALPAPMLAGQPPILQGSGYEAARILGKLMNFDENMSVRKNQACSFCHMPYAGFGGPIPSVNATIVAYPGSVHYRAGKRAAQRYTYSPDFHVLQYNEEQGLFFGGNFWDSRATGYLLQSPDAEQAQHPPVDVAEMGLPDTACIAYRLSQAPYRPLFEQVWGRDSFAIAWPDDAEAACATPGGSKALHGSTTPVRLSPADRTRANEVYAHWGQAISFYESSPAVSPFSSKFDAYLAGKTTLTADELAGLQLFDGKANCNSCHIDGRSTTQIPGQTDTGKAASVAPKFTCFGSANEGLPLNPRVAFYYQSTPDGLGLTLNPYGFAYRDLGMGGFLRSGFGSGPSPNASWTQFAPTVDGQMQVSTARDVAMTPPGCPTTEAGSAPYFQKGFFHNGYIKSLKQLVHFYNTRDKYAYNVTSGHCPAGTIERVTCWPLPEVKNNIDMTVGNLGLTDREEDQLVAFLQTLTDGFTTPYPDRDTFTGSCLSCDRTTNPDCSPSRQGNEALIPTPSLPSCAAEVCGVAPVPTPPVR